MFEDCQSPVCEKKLHSEGKPKRKRRFCSDRCRLDRHMLLRIAELFSSLSQDEAWDVLREVCEAEAEGCPSQGNANGS